jgi:hypothetical protein
MSLRPGSDGDPFSTSAPYGLREHANNDLWRKRGNAYSEYGAVGIGVCGVDELLKVAWRVLPELSF